LFWNALLGLRPPAAPPLRPVVRGEPKNPSAPEP